MVTRSRSTYGLAAAALLAVGALAVPGCSTLADDCENLLCAPDNCVPSTAGGPVSEACGVFVSSDTGSDETGSGTPGAPFKTIGRALTDPRARNVYACAGVAAYEEEVVVQTNVGLYGGLDCATWEYVAGGPRTRIIGPADAAAALQVRGAALVAAVEDVDITASDAATAGRSSVAMLVDGATVDVKRANLVAGAGAIGESSPHAEEQAEDGANAANGAFGCDGDTSSAGGPGGKLTCNGIDVDGGDGGAGILGAAGSNGETGEPTDAGGGEPGEGAGGMPCSPGEAGSVGDPGGDGAGATGLGTLGPSGVMGVSGEPGVDGAPGQGGGGGGGASTCSGDAGPGGGGGGSGGCGGLGGSGGGAGGSSVALISFNASILLLDVALRSGTGGAGGDGQLGQLGGEGGDGGGPGGGGACEGGNGGAGGPGGAGGGGLGGHSIGIAYTGPPPVELGGVTTTIGQAGAGGPSGTGSSDAPEAGAPGRTSERQQF